MNFSPPGEYGESIFEPVKSALIISFGEPRKIIGCLTYT